MRTKLFSSKPFVFIISIITAYLSMAMTALPAAAADVEAISGKLSDGTPYTVHKPAQWNGTIVLDLDGASNPKISPKIAWLTQHGYAYGGTTRNIPGYDFKRAIDNLVTVRSIFAGKFEMPTRTLIHGISRGSFVCRLAMEFEPDIFDGAVVGAGGGSGEIATLNSMLDGLFVLKTLVNPDSPMEIVGVPDTIAATNAETAALKELVAEADATPIGRARLALAAAIEQFAPWTCMGSSEPDATDYDAQYAQLSCPFIGMPNFVFANPISVRAPIEALAGGVVSWNHGIDYSSMLTLSGRKDFVEAMYEKAGASLEDDLSTLANAPRISADPDAVNVIEKTITYTGKIKGPVINVDNTGDPIDPTSCEVAYNRTIRRAGNQKLLRNAIVHSPAHAGINALEFITGFVMLIDRLDNGQWGSTTPFAMNRLARKLAAQSPGTFAGMKPRFVGPWLGVPLRTWDVSDWDTYEPESVTGGKEKQ